MNKVLTALAALSLGLPAMAGTIHDFDPSRVPAPRATLDGQCYSTTRDSKICFFRINQETYAVAINERNNPEYPHVFTINCNNGQFRGFGPLTNEVNQAVAEGFCNSGRY